MSNHSEWCCAAETSRPTNRILQTNEKRLKFGTDTHINYTIIMYIFEILIFFNENENNDTSLQYRESYRIRNISPNNRN